MVSPIDHLQKCKSKVLDFWQAIDAAKFGEATAICERFLAKDFHWKGPTPLGHTHTAQEYSSAFWEPLKNAIPDIKRETHLFCGGYSSGKADGGPDGQLWVCGTGYFHGVAKDAFFGIPATAKNLKIRWTDFYRFEGDEIVECQCIIDFVDWFDQIGLGVLPPSRGVSHVYPAPTAYQGVLSEAQDQSETNKTLEIGRTFVFGGLNEFDESDLSSMGLARFFHDNIKWYGPGGIGACLSLKEFEELHQQPWLVAFPDRKVQDLESLFAEDHILAGSGVAGVIATHTGQYLNQPATGKRIELSGIDFWLRTGEKFTENWVFVDMVHLFDQFGVDLFELMKTKQKAAA